MSATASRSDPISLLLSSPIAARMFEFNLLPSRTLHPERAARLDPPDGIEHAQPPVAQALHRRWSARLLGQLGEAGIAVSNLAEPALPLALATSSQLTQLARDMGTALLGSAIRRVIERSEVMTIRTSLGTEGFNWALSEAAQLHPGLADTQAWRDLGWAEAADQLGAGLLAQAWSDAPAPLKQRANWKLAPGSEQAERRNASGLTAPLARALCMKRLNQTEPEWLSSFPEIH